MLALHVRAGARRELLGHNVRVLGDAAPQQEPGWRASRDRRVLGPPRVSGLGRRRRTALDIFRTRSLPAGSGRQQPIEQFLIADVVEARSRECAASAPRTGEQGHQARNQTPGDDARDQERPPLGGELRSIVDPCDEFTGHCAPTGWRQPPQATEPNPGAHDHGREIARAPVCTVSGVTSSVVDQEKTRSENAMVANATAIAPTLNAHAKPLGQSEQSPPFNVCVKPTTHAHRPQRIGNRLSANPEETGPQSPRPGGAAHRGRHRSLASAHEARTKSIKPRNRICAMHRTNTNHSTLTGVEPS